MTWCDVSWGSHSCGFTRGHDGPCACACCDCPPGHHNGIEAPTLTYDDQCSCVAKPPYYGPDTRFYGADVETRGLRALDADPRERP